MVIVKGSPAITGWPVPASITATRPIRPEMAHMLCINGRCLGHVPGNGTCWSRWGTRWLHPEKGFMNPAAFIPIAEETGVICEIGSWVFQHAFEQLKQWQPLLSDDFQLSINMSPLQLKAREEKFHNWINELNNPPPSGQNIVIEITEGILIKDEPLVNKKLLNFRDAGIQVAIDDFGTGYSSLSYLKEFDIDYLKIDQSFVRNLKPGSREESLSEAIVVMAHKLDLKVIAEGIETEEQCDLLKSIGCDYGQGYYFSRPMPVNEFEQLFEDKK